MLVLVLCEFLPSQTLYSSKLLDCVSYDSVKRKLPRMPKLNIVIAGPEKEVKRVLPTIKGMPGVAIQQAVTTVDAVAIIRVWWREWLN